jgi:hypothetical protein
MTKEEIIRKLLDWPSPHVRRQAARVGVALEALERDGIPYEAISNRRLAVGHNKQVIARYDHPNRTPTRTRSALVFEHRLSPNSTRSNGEILRIETIDELLNFAHNPQRALGVQL